MLTSKEPNQDDDPNKPIVIHGIQTKNQLPENNRPVLFLVDHSCGDQKQHLDTWFGYRVDDKWMGVAEDNEGWQEMAGPVLSWIPFPELAG